jgi:hypothetical protein
VAEQAQEELRDRADGEGEYHRADTDSATE